MLQPINASISTKKVIADIGGTNARFALLNENGSIQDQIVLRGADYPDFISAYREYLNKIGNPKVTDAAIAIANPIDGDVIKMTNHDWNFSIKEAQESLLLETLTFKNDFEALAMSIPFLEENDIYQVGGVPTSNKQPIAVLGPGTGLGVSGLVFSGDKWIALSTEGGHVSLSPTTKREIEVFKCCLKQYEHVSAERLISGGGLVLLYSLICELDKVEVNTDLTAHDISQHALSNSNPQCAEALDIFTGLLGVVAGNLALTLGATGGVFIGGGIVPKLGDYFKSSAFRARFDAKGRFEDYLKEIPVYVIKAKYPALIGIKQVFEFNS